MKRYRSNKGLKKRCDCARRTWETCAHPWFFTFQWKGRVERGSLGVATRDEAVQRFDEIKVAIRNGTYVRPNAKPEPAPGAGSERPTFRMVAEHYARDPEGLAGQSQTSHKRHGYDLAFLATVIVPPGVPFPDKPFADIIRADLKQVLAAKVTPTLRTYKKKGSEKEFTRTVGGKTAANRLYTRLCGLWTWAIEEQYATTSPLIRTRKGKNRLKHDEFGRDRRLRDGEEAALLQHANDQLKDVIVAAPSVDSSKPAISRHFKSRHF